jgi:SAM-dependent methyltransferase
LTEALKKESEKLAASWMRHEAGWLDRYLIADVEDPRINLQSILSRHFLIRAVYQERFATLMAHEYDFAAAMAWLIQFAKSCSGEEEAKALLFGLRRRADNVEGIEIPSFLLRTFVRLDDKEHYLPNYIESFLEGLEFREGQAHLHEPSLATFEEAWAQTLAGDVASATACKPSVLEPACGSANDYRFFYSYGIAGLLDYTGFDLCSSNVANARARFPDIRFLQGNVFEIAAADKSYDWCVVHDLFEHLSPEGLTAAVKEICRVTRQGICLSFFNMDEIPEHAIKPVEDYYWNTLSMSRMRQMFSGLGFAGQVINIGGFLRQCIGCEQTHNPNAYTFFLVSEAPELRT